MDTEREPRWSTRRVSKRRRGFSFVKLARVIAVRALRRVVGSLLLGRGGFLMFKHRPLAWAVAVVASVAVAGPASAAPPVDTSALSEAVPVPGITEHQAALEAIANANVFEGRPTRATGTPGHEASVEYVVDKMEAAGFNVSLQPFEADIFFEQAPAAFEQVAPNPTVYQRFDGENGVWYTADFSGDGDATAAAVAVDFVEPTTVPSTSNSGREPEDFGPEVVGKVALLQRCTCDFGVKVENPQAAGAVAAVIFNEARSATILATAS
jgi:hypothetical protein